MQIQVLKYLTFTTNDYTKWVDMSYPMLLVAGTNKIPSEQFKMGGQYNKNKTVIRVVTLLTRPLVSKLVRKQVVSLSFGLPDDVATAVFRMLLITHNCGSDYKW